MKPKWTEPFTWEEGLRSTSLKIPETEIVPSGVSAFCIVVAWGSEFLLATGKFVLLGLAVVAGGATVVTARRTRFGPVLHSPVQQRRQFGQIIRAAFRLLRTRVWLFLGIGIVFLPLGIIASVVQGLVLSLPVVGPTLDLVDNELAGGLLVVSVGGLHFGIAYWLVIAASTAAIGELEAGRTVGVISAYRLVWDRIGTLLGARLRALAIVAILAVTIIGIPWAFQRAVRWTFLEHAILLGGADARASREASTRLVRGSWWRTLGITSVLAAIGLGLGPLAGVGLILLTSVSLTAINLVSALIYLVSIPYVAIGIVMLYFDLKARKEP